MASLGACSRGKIQGPCPRPTEPELHRIRMPALILEHLTWKHCLCHHPGCVLRPSAQGSSALLRAEAPAVLHLLFLSVLMLQSSIRWRRSIVHLVNHSLGGWKSFPYEANCWLNEFAFGSALIPGCQGMLGEGRAALKSHFGRLVC